MQDTLKMSIEKIKVDEKNSEKERERERERERDYKPIIRDEF